MARLRNRKIDRARTGADLNITQAKIDLAVGRAIASIGTLLNFRRGPHAQRMADVRLTGVRRWRRFASAIFDREATDSLGQA